MFKNISPYYARGGGGIKGSVRFVIGEQKKKKNICRGKNFAFVGRGGGEEKRKSGGTSKRAVRREPRRDIELGGWRIG